MTSKLVVLTLAVALVGACSSNENKVKEKEDGLTFAPPERMPAVSLYGEDEGKEDRICEGDFIVTVDSLHHVTFSDTLEGYEIFADFVPDTAFAEGVGHIEYMLSDGRRKQRIATTYNRFYSKFDEGKRSLGFAKTAFLDSLSGADCVPFKFFDVDFDGIKEFLVIHGGYNYKYYEVFKKNGAGRFVNRDMPPYNELVMGRSGNTTFDPVEKTIKIDRSSGCMSQRSAVYKLQGKGGRSRFECIEENLVERVDGDTLQYTTWKLVDGRLKMVSQTTDPE